MIPLSAHALLLLAFSRVVVSQCEYVYTAEPPQGQLICDPYPINQLQLVCSIFVTNISRPDTLRIQWFFGVPENKQFNPADVTLLQEVEFDVALLRETYTSRIVVSNPPGGFYFCQPLLISPTPLIRSNVVPLQPPNFYLDRGIRPCQVNEFQNSTSPFCAQQGVTLGPDQTIDPAPTVIETIQIINTSLDTKPTQSGLLVIEKTPTPSNTVSGGTSIAPSASVDTGDDSENRGAPGNDDQSLPGIIAGVVLGILTVIVSTILLSIIVALVRQRAHQGRKIPITTTNGYLESPERFDSKSEEVSAHDHTGERTYDDYPKSDGSKIPVSPNQAYATNIVTRKNEVYKSVSTSGSVDEYYVYDYI